MRHHTRLAVATAFLALLLVPLAALAARRPTPPAMGGLLERAAARLDLSTAQKQEIRAILRSHQPELETELAAVKTSRQQLWDAIHADVADEAAIRAAAEVVGEAEADLAVTRAAIVAEVRAVLTPEQREELAEMAADARAFIEALIARLRSQIDLALAG